VVSRVVSLLLGLMLMGQAMAQAGPPLPPPRPSDAPPAAAAPPSPTEPAVPPQADLDGCLTRLKARGFDVEEAQPPTGSNTLCRIQAPVRLHAVPVPSRPGTKIVLPAHPLLACKFAESFGSWLGDLVAPLVSGSLGSHLKAVDTGPGFECRNRNRATSGKLSAHAEGLAIDISGFELTNGSSLRIKPEGDAPPSPALVALRTAGCGWFTTVLGPGSDAAHHDHLHVDIQQHGSSERYRICQ
jgi:hypothetical protein